MAPYNILKELCQEKKILKTLHNDPMWKVYREFDPQDPVVTISKQPILWLNKKGFASSGDVGKRTNHAMSQLFSAHKDKKYKIQYVDLIGRFYQKFYPLDLLQSFR